jgi:hypothetical protein
LGVIVNRENVFLFYEFGKENVNKRLVYDGAANLHLSAEFVGSVEFVRSAAVSAAATYRIANTQYEGTNGRILPGARTSRPLGRFVNHLRRESHEDAATLTGSSRYFIAYVGYRFALPYAIRRLSVGQINVRRASGVKY